jgi:hypothetical protein
MQEFHDISGIPHNESCIHFLIIQYILNIPSLNGKEAIKAPLTGKKTD